MKLAGILSILFALLCQGCFTKKSAFSTREQHSFLPGKKSLNVLSYNVLTGFQKNAQQAERFIRWVKRNDFDVIAMQELSTFTQDSLENFAKRYGHNYAVLNKGNGSPIGITSRFPIKHIERISGSMHHGCIYAEVAGMHLFATHLSPFSYDKCVEEMLGILQRAAAISATEKILIMGDFNSFSPQDSLAYPQGRKYGVIESLLRNGYTDAFYKMQQQFTHSFPTEAYVHKTKNKNRIDYVFANAPASKIIAGAKIIKDSLTHELSDHYPLLISFKY